MALINGESINLNLQGSTKENILKEFAALGYQVGKVSSEEGFYQGLLDRESEVTTGFGYGVAIPHAKTKYANEVGILFGRTNNQVEWQALDDKPVNTFICFIAPEEAANEHLKLLAKISRKLMHQDFVAVLKNGTKEQILQALETTFES
ncbi:PTS system IIA component, Fru family [Granulicatella balaenopterae]|uniref:PTS system IIA component, Fru family n=1 Tax=Granulicatella balaenopterae TaxID=137733 RepID=A0A1H9LNE0_9LACT|nr:PTS fructose transporter subunit IIA [Granulicatella balaenopterae]SER12946.1 PTS system IIA component, Fru family [Granulicatella balaenopterae]